MGPIRCPETSVYHYRLCCIAEECRSRHRGGSPKSRKAAVSFWSTACRVLLPADEALLLQLDVGFYHYSTLLSVIICPLFLLCQPGRNIVNNQERLIQFRPVTWVTIFQSMQKGTFLRLNNQTDRKKR
jgi:hypothetical protein